MSSIKMANGYDHIQQVYTFLFVVVRMVFYCREVSATNALLKHYCALSTERKTQAEGRCGGPNGVIICYAN